jgi:hypothetical protein
MFSGTGSCSGSLLDDDIQRDVETLVATFQPEAVDVPPSGGLEGQAIRLRTMNFIALGSKTAVRDTGIEPVTSSVSGKRSPAELIARDHFLEVETGIEPVCTALQAVASPLGHSTAGVDATASSSG